MHKKTLFFMVAMALVAAPQFALADGDGAVTGVVGGPVGAVVGGVAGGVIGNAASGPDRRRVEQPVSPCGTRTTQRENSDGSGSTTQTTNCQN
jgi:hypothetical protein